MNLTVADTNIPAVKLITLFKASDHRGSFVKPFHDADLSSAGIHFHMKESFYSISKKNVIRGMHFHLPPYEHDKIVFCTQGAIMDVALDLRSDAPTYGQYVCQELSQENGKALFIPKGFAHGFLTLTEGATTFYFISGVYHPASDGGVKYDSFGYDWQGVDPIMSERDQHFQSFQEFQSPFHIF